MVRLNMIVSVSHHQNAKADHQSAIALARLRDTTWTFCPWIGFEPDSPPRNLVNS